MRRAPRVIVLQGDPKPVHVYLAAGGRDGGDGSAVSPLATWGGLVDRLRRLYADGQRRAVVRVVGASPPLGRENRRRIVELEQLGLHLEFRAFDYEARR
ncbi:MAG: hypothetical protein ACREU5_06935 [Burkholderiales bacterium]